MKRLFALLIMLLSLSACTEDYDVFGASDYRVLNELVFENQDGDAFFYPAEHRVEVNLIAPSDSFTWDSCHLGICSGLFSNAPAQIRKKRTRIKNNHI